MSVLKKGLIFLLLGMTVLVAWLLFVPDKHQLQIFHLKTKLNCWQEYLIIVMLMPLEKLAMGFLQMQRSDVWVK